MDAWGYRLNMFLKLSYNHGGISLHDIHARAQKLSPVNQLLHYVCDQSYQQPEGFIRLPFDASYHADSMACVAQKKALQPQALLLIGIGGSNLGACAVYQALRGSYYNERAHEFQAPLFYCADALDIDKNNALKNILEKILQRGENIVIVSVSKSGTTTETTLNTTFFIELLKKYHPHDYADFVVMITDKDSAAWRLAEQEGYAKLAIPKNVGGRFSVFSAVGLFPLAMLNINVHALCAGAQEITEQCLYSLENDAARSAIILFQQYQAGLTIHDTFFFDTAFDTLGAWYRQLMAESLGKDGRGIMPTISMAVDLHSMAQLSFGGPRVRCTTLVPAVVKEATQMAQVQQMIFEGVQAAYAKEGLPFMTLQGLEKTERAVGAFLQLKMLEIVYLGYLLEVNVFDQPHVEIYKQEVRSLLQKNC